MSRQTFAEPLGWAPAIVADKALGRTGPARPQG